MEFFESLGVDMELSDMSFSVSLDNGRGCEWGSRNGLSGLFAQKRNVLNPYFLQMIREIVKFKDDVIRQVVSSYVYTFICLVLSNCEVYRIVCCILFVIMHSLSHSLGVWLLVKWELTSHINITKLDGALFLRVTYIHRHKWYLIKLRRILMGSVEQSSSWCPE